MNIQQQNGIISTINFVPFFDIKEYQNLRSSIFNEARILSDFSPREHVDIFDESILVFDNYFQAFNFLITVFRIAVKQGELSGITFCLKSSLCKGDYFIQQDQIYGDAVNLATRLSCSSRENEMLVCGIDKQIIDEFIDSQNDVGCFPRCREDNCVSICLLDKDSTNSKLKSKVLQIKHNNQSTVFNKSRHQQIHIGRSDDSDIFIVGDHISRNHATLTLKYDNIYIEDHSANGTYLYFGGREIFLLNDSMKLDSSGTISCGRNRQSSKSSADIISYMLSEDAKSAA